MNLSRKLRPAGPFSPAGLAIVVAVSLVDQVSKLVADAAIPAGTSIPLLPILSLFRVNNTGIALSFLADSGVMLIALMVVVMLVVGLMWARAEDGGALAALGYALIIGGAFGNLIDRIRLGHVIDFLYLHLGPRPLFVFNLADVALTIGPALLLYVFVWPRRDDDETS